MFYPVCSIRYSNSARSEIKYLKGKKEILSATKLILPSLSCLFTNRQMIIFIFLIFGCFSIKCKKSKDRQIDLDQENIFFKNLNENRVSITFINYTT